MLHALLIFRLMFLLAAGIFLAAGITRGADSCRIVMLELPRGQADSFAADLARSRDGDPSTMDALFKRIGCKPLIDKTASGDCWDPVSQTIEGKEYRSPRKYLEDLKSTTFGSARPHEASVDLMTEKHPLGVREDMVIHYESLDAKGRKACHMSCETPGIWVVPGRWQELGRFGDSKTETMVWQFGTAEKLPATTSNIPPEEDIAIRAFRENQLVEVKVFTAADPDLAQLAKAAPASRETAMNWLADRAKLWHDIRHLSLVRQPTSFHFMDFRYDDKKVAGPIQSDQLRVGIARGVSADQVTASGPIIFTLGEYMGNPPTRTDLKATMDAGVWNFQPFSSPACGVNLIAWRITKAAK